MVLEEIFLLATKYPPELTMAQMMDKGVFFLLLTNNYGWSGTILIVIGSEWRLSLASTALFYLCQALLFDVCWP